MKTIPIQRFNKVDYLMRIKYFLLVQFSDRFKEDCKAKGIQVPTTEPGSDSFYGNWAAMFGRAESLPEAMSEAVQAMEEYSTAENWPVLQGTIARARLYANFGVDTSCSPESQALQLWLWSPYRVGGGLSEVEPKIEAGRKVWEEQQRADREYQAKEDEKLRKEEGGGQTGSNEEGRVQNEESGGDKKEKAKKQGPIMPAVKIDSDAALTKYFVPYQINWIQAEDAIHAQHKQAFALAEKSVRIGWTYADSFKNVRKRLRFKNRDYLFATRDYPSALEYMRHAHKFAELFGFTKAIVAHGEDHVNVNQLDEHGKETGFKEEVKMGYIKFDNGSCIRAFSSHPQAMAVYGGDVGLDEFAKHPNAPMLWESAQGRMTWAYDMAVWSAHAGEDTLFYQFAQEARAGKGPWNLYYKVTMLDAIGLGLLHVVNRVRGTFLVEDEFMAACKSRSGVPGVFEQSYLCEPSPSAAGIVEWSAIERCRCDYKIERVHLESEDVRKQFGEYRAELQYERTQKIRAFIHQRFRALFKDNKGSKHWLGFDVAASGEGDLMAIYIDEQKGSEMWLRALFTCRTEDWDFIKTVLFTFMRELRYMQGAGDETSLGKMICWEAVKAFPGRFTAVNFSSRKQEIGLSLMNQLSVAEKRFPRSELDIAMDYAALRKTFHGNKLVFSEGKNTHNPASHCDIAWAGGLATEAKNCQSQGIGAMTW